MQINGRTAAQTAMPANVLLCLTGLGRAKQRTMGRVTRAFVLGLLMVGAAGFAAGQTERGGISGQVTDNTGAILPDTIVTLKNEATGVVQKAKTNSDGNYTFQD